jgi:hypothetical protein
VLCQGMNGTQDVFTGATKKTWHLHLVPIGHSAHWDRRWTCIGSHSAGVCTIDQSCFRGNSISSVMVPSCRLILLVEHTVEMVLVQTWGAGECFKGGADMHQIPIITRLFRTSRKMKMRRRRCVRQDIRIRVTTSAGGAHLPIFYLVLRFLFTV